MNIFFFRIITLSNCLRFPSPQVVHLALSCLTTFLRHQRRSEIEVWKLIFYWQFFNCRKQKKSSKNLLNPKVRHKKIKDEANQPNQSPRKRSLGNNSSASVLHAGKMSAKDRRLLKMILVIFISFLICYLPITLAKVFPAVSDVHFLFIFSYLFVYLTTCINPVIYVVMSSGELEID